MTTAQHMLVSALQAQSECIIRSFGPDDKTAQRLAQMGILPGGKRSQSNIKCHR